MKPWIIWLHKENMFLWLVGIDNGGWWSHRRIYSLVKIHSMERWWDKYMQFIVETLKPLYRSALPHPGRQSNTASWELPGRLISHYGSLKYQDVFSKAGSSLFPIGIPTAYGHLRMMQENKMNSLAMQLCGKTKPKWKAKCTAWMNTLVWYGFGQDNVFNKVVIGGQHNEKLWREAFGDAYIWLFERIC